MKLFSRFIKVSPQPEQSPSTTKSDGKANINIFWNRNKLFEKGWGVLEDLEVVAYLRKGYLKVGAQLKINGYFIVPARPASTWPAKAGGRGGHAPPTSLLSKIFFKAM